MLKSGIIPNASNDILVDYVNGLHPIPSMKWSEVDIVYVLLMLKYALGTGSSSPCSEENICSGDPKVKNSGTLNGCMMFLNKSMSNGDCGMFLIKYAEYLMHDDPLSSLTGSRIDWFREKMATELSYFKILPM
ncbi:hypothetical protein CK203_045269 [Vitis vinifera]|uniref:Ubiquitin-like protease family profile domain-containing protein n=1 Tax=Vitis vinifera TaxID=29760 RepID=A0A438HIC2_VITVI|nr:hypothetical protein CK203_045269 [Vitis vinifera]